MKSYAATIGFFDGVHRGHRYLIGQLLTEAARRELDAALITFEDHPRNTLQSAGNDSNNNTLLLLNTFEERTELLKNTGVTEIFCFQYPLIQGFTAKEFMQVLHERCAVDVLLMGYDHRFGSDLRNEGRTIEDYVREGKEVGIEVVPVEQSPEGNMSSSKIRRALTEGRIEDANAMLGYDYTISGKVEHGKHIGHKIGFPTANIVVEEHKLIPKNGVYACEVECDTEYRTLSAINTTHFLPAIVNIGTNPTVGNNPQTIEVHIPGLNEDLYDRQLTIHLTRRLRDEITFPTLEALQKQIEEDIQQISSSCEEEGLV